jgi:membrane dipeptidase
VADPGAVPIVDAHLDLAFNVVDVGRDLTRNAAELRASERRDAEQVTATLPDLRRGGVAVVFGTIFTAPAGKDLGAAVPMSGVGAAGEQEGYSTPEEAEAMGLEQLAVYEGWAREGHVRLLTDGAGLAAHMRDWAIDGVPGLVVLMEGADPIVEPAALESWARRGLRVIGPAWATTRYSCGTGDPGPLTDLGRELIAAANDLGLAIDLSHLALDAAREAVELADRVAATHVHPHALVPTDRQLPDDVLAAVAARGGVVGITLVNHFLEPDWEPGGPSVTVAGQWARHAAHIAAVTGWEHVGIGTDLDGGVGLEETPEEIDTVADLHVLGDAVPREWCAGVLGGNWLRWLEATLP